ncbi:MAG: WbqC family protein, partial [Bacteroidales bacterium]|nr:WbqC family protein [Bacteroidales bacterium]
MQRAILATAYLAPVEYFYFLINCEPCIEAHDLFQKQTYRSRCTIVTATGVQTLSIPVVHHAGKMPIREVAIDYKTAWQRQHWKSIITAYSKSPYFLYYRDYLEPFFTQRTETLFELNTAITTLILKLLKAKTVLSFTSEYVKNYVETVDLRHNLSPKRLVDFSTGFTLSQYERSFVHHTHFHRGISIIDLLFHKGMESLDYLQKYC